jgi:uncharacterized protein (TIGR03067 family)
MKPLACLVALAFCGIARADDPPAKAPAAADHLQRFQGTWRVEEWDTGGKPADDLKTREAFFGANVFVFRRTGKPVQAGTVQLDGSKTPNTINLSVREGEGRDEVLLGIYELEGDSLTLCFDPKGQQRPKDFKPDAKDGFVLVTLRKPKPPADEAVNIVGKYNSAMIDAMTGKPVLAEVTVERRGDGYVLTYRTGDKVLFVGTALRKGDQLSMCWASAGQAGVSVYKIEAGPKLVGEFTTLGGLGVVGKETLTPWKKTD